MNKFFKQEKGINLISLTITIIIILIITGILIFNARDSIYIKNLQNMYNDISTLREKVSLYYSQYGAIPAKYEFNNIGNLQSAGVIGANDTGKFYIIDLKALPSLTLNYGKDYYKAEEENSDINSLEDVYIINETSHNIFYVQGVSVKSGDTTKVYYTDEENIDTAEVDIKPIPEEKAKVGEIVREKNKEYINNGTAIIPVGFMIVPGADDVSKGLVISDNSEDTEEDSNNIVAKGNQFVWVPVDKVTLCAAGIQNKEVAKLQQGSTTDYEGISYNFVGTTSEKIQSAGIGTSSYREPDMVTTYDNNKEQYLNIINNILKNIEVEPNFTELNNANDLKTYLQREYNDIVKSIKTNGGFYIGRYESSLSSSSDTVDGATGTIQSKRNILPAGANNTSTTNRWYGFYAKQKEFASTIEGTTIKSTMIYGSMYDAVMNWALNDDDEKNKIKANSTSRGSKQPTGTKLSTGEYDIIKNIYDLGNNVGEWTVEASGTENRVARGSSYSYNVPPSDRTPRPAINVFTFHGSRLLIYL